MKRIVIGLLVMGGGALAYQALQSPQDAPDGTNGNRPVTTAGTSESGSSGRQRPASEVPAAPQYSDRGAEFRRPDALPPALQKLADQVTNVSLPDDERVRALKALSYNADKVPSEVLMEWSGSQSADIRLVVQGMLAKKGTPEVMEHFLKELESGRAQGPYAIRALSTHATGEQFERFTAWLQSKASNLELAEMGNSYALSAGVDGPRIAATSGAFLALAKARPAKPLMSAVAILREGGHLDSQLTDKFLTDLNPVAVEAYQAQLTQLSQERSAQDHLNGQNEVGK